MLTVLHVDSTLFKVQYADYVSSALFQKCIMLPVHYDDSGLSDVASFDWGFPNGLNCLLKMRKVLNET